MVSSKPPMSIKTCSLASVIQENNTSSILKDISKKDHLSYHKRYIFLEYLFTYPKTQYNSYLVSYFKTLYNRSLSIPAAGTGLDGECCKGTDPRPGCCLFEFNVQTVMQHIGPIPIPFRPLTQHLLAESENHHSPPTMSIDWLVHECVCTCTYKYVCIECCLVNNSSWTNRGIRFMPQAYLE